MKGKTISVPNSRSSPYLLWSGKKVGMPNLFGGKAVPMRVSPRVVAGLKTLKKMGWGKK